jgi:hypothetical protein
VLPFLGVLEYVVIYSKIANLGVAPSSQPFPLMTWHLIICCCWIVLNTFDANNLVKESLYCFLCLHLWNVICFHFSRRPTACSRNQLRRWWVTMLSRDTPSISSQRLHRFSVSILSIPVQYSDIFVRAWIIGIRHRSHIRDCTDSQ